MSGDEYVSRCPACGEPVDYCPGHGRIGDPILFSRLVQHDEGDHTECSWACEDKVQFTKATLRAAYEAGKHEAEQRYAPPF